MSRSANPIELPPWAAFLLRQFKRLGLALLLLAAAALLLELVSPLLFPGRSPRFLVAGTADGQPAWTENPFFTYRFYPGRLGPPPPRGGTGSNG
jgi:hypothetical protein